MDYRFHRGIRRAVNAVTRFVDGQYVRRQKLHLRLTDRQTSVQFPRRQCGAFLTDCGCHPDQPGFGRCDIQPCAGGSAVEHRFQRLFGSVRGIHQHKLRCIRHREQHIVILSRGAGMEQQHILGFPIKGTAKNHVFRERLIEATG